MAEIPPRIRPDILQKADERRCSVDGVNPFASGSRARMHRKRGKVPQNAKGKDSAKYSDPEYWNEVEWRNKQERRLDKSTGIAWKAIVIASAAICSPALLPVLYASLVCFFMFTSSIILVCGPWAIAGYALYKSVELFVESKPTPPFEKVNRDNMRDEVHVMDDGITDETEAGHMTF